MLSKKLDAIVVILYNPDSFVLDNILTYIERTKSLYIIDNSTLSHNIIEKLNIFNNISVLHSGGNIGVAKALNIALDQASKDNYKWLMTIDQDSSFNQDDANFFIKSLTSLSYENLAIISPLHNKKFIKYNMKHPWEKKEFVMTSANIVNIKIAKKVGGYNEKFFIDEVDHDFCFRLKKYNYCILQNSSISINHTLGIKFNNITLYPSIRLYYMVRNYLSLKEEYKLYHFNFFKQRDKYLLKFFFIQIFYGKYRLLNIKMIVKGIHDFKKNSKWNLINLLYLLPWQHIMEIFF